MSTTMTQLQTSVCALSAKRSELSGTTHEAFAVALPALRPVRSARLSVVAKGQKVNVKEPFGPTGGVKFKGGLDASGRKATGKGVYQFSKKYGANVDGYSPIYVPDEWAPSGDTYTGGQAGLTLWALTFGALLILGAILVYNTSALA